MTSQPRKGISKGTKIAVVTSGLLAGTYFAARGIYKKARKIAFGDPERPLRKALIYTAIAGTIIAHKYGDEIKDQWNEGWNRISEIVQERDTDKINKLEQEIKGKYVLIDSLEEANKILEQENKKNQEKNKQTIEELKRITNEKQDLEEKVKEYEVTERVRSEYTQNTAIEQPRTETTRIRMPPRTHSETKPAQTTNTQQTSQWYIVKPGETLSGISLEFYGNMNQYKELARHNNIHNPSDIPVGYPLKLLPGKPVNTKKNIQAGQIPRYTTIRRGQTLTEVVRNETGITRQKELDSKTSEIIRYNNSLGNRILDMQRSRIREAIIYIR